MNTQPGTLPSGYFNTHTHTENVGGKYEVGKKNLSLVMKYVCGIICVLSSFLCMLHSAGPLACCDSDE